MSRAYRKSRKRNMIRIGHMVKPTKHAVVLGTKNKDKLRELRRMLKGSGVRVLSLADFPLCRDVKETGKTFEANARLKARAYSRHTRSLVLADDSGLMVARLRGKPGVYSARFAGAGCTYADNNKKLLRLMKDAPPAKRAAMFVCVMALYDSGRAVKMVRGECRGRVAPEARGSNGFGYDPVFIPSGKKKTFAELIPAAKNALSHRGRALRKAARAVRAYCQT